MERAPGGMLDTTMRLLMRKNSVYIAFIFTGAIIGERVVDYGFNKVWERNNVGVSHHSMWFTVLRSSWSAAESLHLLIIIGILSATIVFLITLCTQGVEHYDELY